MVTSHTEAGPAEGSLDQEDGMKSVIVFNGREYASLGEMPVEVRRDYARAMRRFFDANRMDLPEFLDFQGKAYVLFKKRVYSSLKEMPAEVRREYDRAMRSFVDDDEGTLPEAAEGGSRAALDAVQQVWISSDNTVIPSQLGGGIDRALGVARSPAPVVHLLSSALTLLMFLAILGSVALVLLH